MRLKDKVAIITGGGVGIGKATSLAFANEGADVVVASRTGPRLEEVAAQVQALGRRSLAIVTDVSKEDQVKSMVAKTIDEFGKIDILVNNAGIMGPTVSIVDMELKDWQETLDIDLTGAMLCTREVLKHMIPQKSGRIINISSVAGKRGYDLRSPYSAAKWGLIGFTHTTALETGPHNIYAHVVCPGAVEGDRIDAVLKARAEAMGIPYNEDSKKAMGNAVTQRSPLGRMVTNEEVAALVVFLASDESSGMTGQCINVTAGMEMR